MSEAANAAQITYWNETGSVAWVELQDMLDTQVEPMGRPVIELLDPKPGERVLDVGCGCGQTVLTLADRVGREGEVLGMDISGPMLEVARRRTKGLPQVRLEQADAQVCAFDAQRYDAVYSRFGVMFFDDPPAAFANLRRALKPGGRLAFLCWRPMAENPIMALPMQVAAKHVALPPPPPPGAPGPFAFADADRVRTILQQAGFADVSLTPQDMPAGGNTVEGALTLALRVGPLGALLRENPGTGPVVEADIRAALAAHADADGRVFLDSATWIVTARNP
jgi:SAM-dependent methyltransferase